MKNRQYYHNKENDKKYHVDICLGDNEECKKSIDEFVDKFNGENILCVFINDNNSDVGDYVSEISENIKNFILLYTNIDDIGSAVSVVEDLNITRLNSHPWLIGSNSKKEGTKQVVFNITKQYLREQKLNRITDV